MNKGTEIKLLIKQAQRHDKDAFSQLINIYLKDMYRTAISILKKEEDAADAIQDTILSCWEKMDTLVRSEYFKTWMTRILINHCYDILRERAVIVDLNSYEEPSGCDEYNIEFKEAINSIDEKYRLPVELYYGQEFKVREIAQIMSLPPNTIKTYLSRGRKQLARYYGKEI